MEQNRLITEKGCTHIITNELGESKVIIFGSKKVTIFTDAINLTIVGLTTNELTLNAPSLKELTLESPFVQDLKLNSLGVEKIVIGYGDIDKLTITCDSLINLTVKNKISELNLATPNLKILNASGNRLTKIQLPSSVEYVNLSSNPLESLDLTDHMNLFFLNLNGTNIKTLKTDSPLEKVLLNNLSDLDLELGSEVLKVISLEYTILNNLSLPYGEYNLLPFGSNLKDFGLEETFLKKVRLNDDIILKSNNGKVVYCNSLGYKIEIFFWKKIMGYDVFTMKSGRKLIKLGNDYILLDETKTLSGVFLTYLSDEAWGIDIKKIVEENKISLNEFLVLSRRGWEKSHIRKMLRNLGFTKFDELPFEFIMNTFQTQSIIDPMIQHIKGQFTKESENV